VYTGRSIPDSWNPARHLSIAGWNPERPTKMRELVHIQYIENIGSRRANPWTLEDSHWLLLWRAFTIGQVSADQHKHIGIWRRATHHSNENQFY
jgi:hypothetical protein